MFFGKAKELVDSDRFEFCCYYPCLWSKILFRINRFSGTKWLWQMVLFQINRFSGTKWPRMMVLYRENVSGGTKTRQNTKQADNLSPVLSGFLLHSIRLVFIQGETLGLTDPLLLLQFDIFLGLLERDIAGKI